MLYQYTIHMEATAVWPDRSKKSTPRVISTGASIEQTHAKSMVKSAVAEALGTDPKTPPSSIKMLVLIRAYYMDYARYKDKSVSTRVVLLDFNGAAAMENADTVPLESYRWITDNLNELSEMDRGEKQQQFDRALSLIGQEPLANIPQPLKFKMDIFLQALDYFDWQSWLGLRHRQQEQGQPVERIDWPNYSRFTIEAFLQEQGLEFGGPNKNNSMSNDEIRAQHLAYSILRKMEDRHLLEKDDVVPFTKNIPHSRYRTRYTRGSPTEREWVAYADVLGEEIVYYAVSMYLCHIVGKDEFKSLRSGTGIPINETSILTCRHVVEDMEVQSVQELQGQEHTLVCARKSDFCDVAVLEVREPSLRPVRFVDVREPVVTERVFISGYPIVPGFREAPAIIHAGEVTSEPALTMDKQRLFLYSAVARPGNSGGPIVSSDGRLVGIVSDLPEGEYLQEGKCEHAKPVSHFAGVPGSDVSRQLAEWGIDLDRA